ncbi:MAG: hypothetical protein J1F31_03445 [Erysipelotrichales bacterium]|nr:hypothetical protein [Erysipelotrichales bacterium]
MGELKGQILGILLVLMVFGGLITAYTAVFNNAQTTITTRANNYINSETMPNS